ncbi:MAG: mannitol-1-phosphate 5-dehydrogenase, partial [Bacteroidales bacterium]|nr:mannitol-1-phosphate 5-dehydrogenase [Bacteroidales bacterium]
MKPIHPKKILLFGAGRIGRSFIAQLFHQAGFKLVFVDIDKNLVDLLNKRKSYPVVIKGNYETKLEISLEKALHLDEKEQILRELSVADICSVSVGQRGLLGVADLLAQGITERHSIKPLIPLDIILAENLRDAAKWMKQNLEKKIPSSLPLDEYVGLIETSIGKMVPIMTERDLENDPLQVFAEPYNTLILDEKAFRNPIPDIKGLAPKKNMKAWVDRKLFIHNLGHVCLAYLGFIKNQSWKYTWEALNDREIRNEVFLCMQESASVLLKMYPNEFTRDDLTAHIKDLLDRFGNKALGDTIFRVGCDLGRKLGPEDRLVPVIKSARVHGLPYQSIMKVLVSGIYFDARDEKGRMNEHDLQFVNIFNRDVVRILTDHCKFEASENNTILF